MQVWLYEVSISSIQLHNIDYLDSAEGILPPEYRRHKGRVAHKRIKSSIESNVCKTALSDKTNVIAGAPLENTYKNQESKTLRCCKNCMELDIMQKHILWLTVMINLFAY